MRWPGWGSSRSEGALDLQIRLNGQPAGPAGGMNVGCERRREPGLPAEAWPASPGVRATLY